MSRAGFNGRWTAQMWVLASTVAGMNWSPIDGETQALSNARGQIDSWWGRHLRTIIQVMQKAPQTAASCFPGAEAVLGLYDEEVISGFYRACDRFPDNTALISGFVKPDSGQVFFRGNRLRAGCPGALQAGRDPPPGLS